MTEKRRVGVLFGGRSGEHEVSLMSARSIMGALDRTKYDVVGIGITKEGHWVSGSEALEFFEQGREESLETVTLLPDPREKAVMHWGGGQEMRPLHTVDVIFPVLHGTFGEDGTLQGLLELADIPYVGAGVLASAVAMDKDLFKSVMRANRIPIVDWIVVPTTRLEEDIELVLSEAEAMSPYPLFAKPANLGSSVGITKCTNRSDLIEGLMAAAQYDRRVLVEKGLQAREIEVSVLGNEEPEASIPGEIVPSAEFYTYEAKYIDESSELLIPAPIDPGTAEEARRLSVEAYKAIDGAGMARVDFLLETDTEKLYMNEINTIPGFTKISMYPKLWEASGLPYAELLDRLLDLAFARQRQKDQLVRSYGGEG